MVLRRHVAWLVLCVMGLLARPASAQNLRYHQHREVRIPEYATIMLGPFHSSWRFSLSTGYRWIDTTGAGTDFLFAGSRGGIKKDGSDIPVIVGLTTRNYLIINRHTDLDVSVAFRYEYFPLDTQESRFRIYLPEEGLSATVSSEFMPASFMRVGVYDTFQWRTDYIDETGLEDRYGGREFEYIENTVALRGDVLVARDHNLGFGVSRNDRWALDEAFEDQTRVAHKGHLLYEYMMASYLVVGARAGVGHYSYPDVDRPDVLIHQYSVLSRLGLTPRSTLSASVGVALADYDAQTTNESVGVSSLTAGVALETKLSPELSHQLSYRRGLEAGYQTAVEERDQLRYELNWLPEATRSQFYAEWNARTPSNRRLSEYSDQRVGVNTTIPLFPFLSLLAGGYYGTREVDRFVDGEGGPGLRSGYDTWAGRVGTSVKISDGIDWVCYYEHIERDGDEADLDYTRDVVAAMFTYTRDL